MRRLSLVVLVSFIVSIFFIMADKTSALDKPKGYPKRAIEVVVPHGPGSGADQFSRAFLKATEKELGVPFKFSFMPGAAASIGSAYALAQPADGYVILMVSNDLVINEALKRGKAGVDKFEWLGRGVHEISALHTRLDNKPLQSIQDIKDYCAKNKNAKLTVAGSGALGIDHVWVEVLAKRGNLGLKFIPFDSGGERKASFQGGHTTFISGELVEMAGLTEAKFSSPFIIGYEKRLGGKYADVPCTGEMGINNNIGRWRGFVVKKGTPKPIVDYLTALLKQSFESGEYQKFLKDEVGHDRPAALFGKDFEKFAISERAELTTVVKDLGWIEEKKK
jgi:putative tricarboxylic transport membrane protein